LVFDTFVQLVMKLQQKSCCKIYFWQRRKQHCSALVTLSLKSY